MAKTIFEEMGGAYVRQGDYLLPYLSLPTEKENKPIGVWGQRHLRYLKAVSQGMLLHSADKRQAEQLSCRH